VTGTIRLIAVFGAAILVLLVLLPFQLVGLLFVKLGWTGAGSLVPVWFHRAILFLFGIRVQLEGNLSRDRPLLIVANHLSWLDIVVVGSIAPLSFVAKADMASWPIFGQLAKLQRTVFIKREERRSSGQQASDIAERMTAREIMVLFPEGTTTDGNKLAPFKTPLFEAAKIALAASPVDIAIVQPIAIDYARLHGMPVGRSDRPHVAWPGEIGLIESLVPVVRKGALDVVIHVGAPIAMDATSNRKIIAAEATSAIRDMLDSSAAPR